MNTGAYLHRALAKCFRWRCRVKEVIGATHAGGKLWLLVCCLVALLYDHIRLQFVTHRRHSCTHSCGVCFPKVGLSFLRYTSLPRSFPWPNVPWLPLTVPGNSCPSANCPKPKELVPPPYSWIDLARAQPVRHITHHPTHRPAPDTFRRARAPSARNQ